MKQTAVVTGASGFIGKALCTALRAAGASILPISRSAGEGWLQVADYRDSPPAEVLVHLAEVNDRGRANAAGAEGQAAAVQTMKALLGKGYKRVIYASSSVLYGDEELQPHGPGAPVHLTDTYCRTKWECERLVLQTPGNLVLRLSNIYGPGMSPQNVVSTILQQVPGEGDVCVWDARPIRDFLWIDDAAAALVAATASKAAGVLNLGSGVGHSVEDIARNALAHCNEQHRQVCSTKPTGRNSHLVLNIAETTQSLGWRPTTHLNEGIGRLISTRTRLTN